MLLAQSSLWFLVRFHFLHRMKRFSWICGLFFVFEIHHFGCLLGGCLSLSFGATRHRMRATLTIRHWVDWKVRSFDLFASFLFAIKEFVLFIGIFLLLRWLLLWCRSFRLWSWFWICFSHSIHDIYCFTLRFAWSWTRFALSSVRYWTLYPWFIRWWPFFLIELVWYHIWWSISWPFGQLHFLWGSIFFNSLWAILLPYQCLFACPWSKQCLLRFHNCPSLHASFCLNCFLTLILSFVKFFFILVIFIGFSFFFFSLQFLQFFLLRLLGLWFLMWFIDQFLPVLFCSINFCILIVKICIGLSDRFWRLLFFILSFWVLFSWFTIISCHFLQFSKFLFTFLPCLSNISTFCFLREFFLALLHWFLLALLHWNFVHWLCVQLHFVHGLRMLTLSILFFLTITLHIIPR